MDILINWLIAFAVVMLLFWGFYLVVKLAVKKAVREVINEFGREVAKKLWEDEDEQPTQEPQD